MTGTDNYLFKGQWVVRTLTTGVKASFHCDPLSNNITASNPTTSWLDFLSCNAQYSHDGQYFQGCTFETESSTMSAQRSCMASEVDEVVDDDASDISDDIDFDFGNNDDYTPVSVGQRTCAPPLMHLQPVLGKAPKSPKDKIGSGSTYAALNSEENCNDQHLVSTTFHHFRQTFDHHVRPPSLRTPSATKLGRNMAGTLQDSNLQQHQPRLTMRWKHLLYAISHDHCFIALNHGSVNTRSLSMTTSRLTLILATSSARHAIKMYGVESHLLVADLHYMQENSMVIEAYDASSSGVHPVVDPTTMREVLQAGKVDTEVSLIFT